MTSGSTVTILAHLVARGVGSRARLPLPASLLGLVVDGCSRGSIAFLLQDLVENERGRVGGSERRAR